MEKSKLLITIVNEDGLDEVISIYNHYKIPLNISVYGVGTANSNVLSYLGLEETKKQIIFSIMAEKLEKDIFNYLDHGRELYKPGNGIAFSIPISSLTAYIANSSEKSLVNKECALMEKDDKYQLIIIIVSAEYSDQAMDAAKTAGATGGTLIHGRGLGTSDVTEFLGITIAPEKNVILILAENEKKKVIMEKVTEEVGLNTKGKGFCLSIPVDHVIGLTSSIN